jgi:starch phosphorylase
MYGGRDSHSGTVRALGPGHSGASLFRQLVADAVQLAADRSRWRRATCDAIALNASYFNTHRMVQQYIVNAYP